ncbi:hypothetical protein PX690_21520 [Bacillus velezensis]|uniref:hypothetical protein n=1 Tax=Bacillus velezensis TaxID=492670 RepID=UPI0023E137AC|nr:hypothetical protein [Bacillus velezensis]WES02048.1 hypothetical protein PX690_21520 [Bacillus velezensis]
MRKREKVADLIAGQNGRQRRKQLFVKWHCDLYQAETQSTIYYLRLRMTIHWDYHYM